MNSFETVFAVHMTCQSCVDSVSKALSKVSGVESVKCDLEKELVSVKGRAAPSAMVSAIQSTGRDAILRGSGAPNSAAVCILETTLRGQNPVRGLVRMVQVSPKTTLFDVSLNRVLPGDYHVTVRSTGNLSDGAISTGSILDDPRGRVCTLPVSQEGTAKAYVEKEMAVWELIGRSIVVSCQADGVIRENTENTLAGVIARSAGVWENDKIICACSGKTLWEERQEQREKGIL